MVVGYTRVTLRAYSQSRERIEAATRFAEAAVNNTPGLNGVPVEAITQLKAQIERDVLVILMQYAPEQES